MRIGMLALLVLPVGVAQAAEPTKPNTLTHDEIVDGWIQLFDGQTIFGWKREGGAATVENGELVLAGQGRGTVTTTGCFGAAQVHLEVLVKEGKGCQIMV